MKTSVDHTMVQMRCTEFHRLTHSSIELNAIDDQDFQILNFGFERSAEYHNHYFLSRGGPSAARGTRRP